MKPDDRARRLYTDTFGTEPAAVASAPGRVNLIGEHVDYHGGHVMPVAIMERTAVAVGPADGRLRAVSENRPLVEWPWPPVRHKDWSDYVAGVAALSNPERPPLDRGLQAAVASDVPIGMGVSSSAALEVATAFALARWSGAALVPRMLADLAWRAETEFVGMPCGQMDQLAAAFAPLGSALLIDCRTQDMQPVPVGVDLVLVDSGESRGLLGSAYDERRREGAEALARLRTELPALLCLVDIPPARLPALASKLGPPLDKRVRHVVNENQRAVLAARALESGDHATFGALVNQSHESLRTLYECSTPRLDAIVAAARLLPGVLGARLVGAGWGGCVLVVVEPGRGPQVVDLLAADTSLKLPQVRLVRAGAGAE